jgi:aminopeptidase N
MILLCTFLAPKQSAIALPQKCGHSSNVEDPRKKSIVRLSMDVMPVNYDLTVEPDMKKFTFSGSEEITLDVAKPTREIVLNAADLDVLQAHILPADASSVQGLPGASGEGSNKSLEAQIVPDTKSERVRFVLGKKLPAGKYRLFCKFKGILDDKLRGLYRSSFEDDKHIRRWLCVTQMEPIDARRMFPCFDEPEFKATYHLRAVIDPIYSDL